MNTNTQESAHTLYESQGRDFGLSCQRADDSLPEVQSVLSSSVSKVPFLRGISGISAANKRRDSFKTIRPSATIGFVKGE